MTNEHSWSFACPVARSLRLIAGMILPAVLLVSLAGCGGGGNVAGARLAPTSTSTPVPTPTPTPQPGIEPGSVSCNPPAIYQGETSQCSAKTYDDNYASAVVWSADSGTIDSSGLFTASDATGFVTISVANQDSSSSGTTVVVVMKKTPMTILHSFSNSDGAAPTGLIEAGRNSGSPYFYGITSSGGSVTCTPQGCGTLFTIDASGNLTTLYKFGAGASSPSGSLTQDNSGNFYGALESGGSGSIFKYDPSHGVSIFHAFSDSLDGAEPNGGPLLAKDGYFYGTTFEGGCANDKCGGVIYRMDSAAKVTVLHSFDVETRPAAGLMQASDGYLYGTNEDGGGSGKGEVFRIDSSGNFTSLHSFDCNDGADPMAPLIQGRDGYLYGTTSGGPFVGEIFRMDTSGNVTVLHMFWIFTADGAGPEDVLLEGSDGNFYGTTPEGGASGEGTIFRMDASGNVTLLHSFSGPPDGTAPSGGLIEGSDGYLYGTTKEGGAFGFGTVFKIDVTGK
jgi:uncharacterized repeat protein (TIGR03803 family)